MNKAFNIHRAIFAILLLASGRPAIAETDVPHPTYTWSLTPTTGDWDTPANWDPEGVPDAYNEQAVFGASSVTNITSSTFKILRSVQFEAGAGQYIINASASIDLDDEGVFNDSGITQIFNGTTFSFGAGATAGDLVTYNATSVSFGNGGDPATATFYLTGGAFFSGGPSAITTAGNATFYNSGGIGFFKLTDAGEATFINYGGDSFGAAGAQVYFHRKSNAASSTIILYGGSVSGAYGASLTFYKSNAGSATLIAYGGTGDPGSGGNILFLTESGGGLARVEVFGNGSIDFSRPGVANNTIGSLEGDGIVYLGDGTLTIGYNNLSTTFGGTFTEEGGFHEGGPGSISKTGSGTLTLTGANDYTAGTTVESGLLFVNNTSGSATGSGPVSVAGGGLAGDGIITGPLTVGTGSSSGAALAPGVSSSTTGTLTVQNALSLLADATYEAQLNSTTLLADDVTAAGVIINGAKIRVGDLGATALASGTSFTLINNTSFTPISGTFSNLPDGGTLTIGNNTFQANYEGGDGNDLTLTVVP